MVVRRFTIFTPALTVAGCRLDASSLSFSRPSSAASWKGLALISHRDGALLWKRTRTRKRGPGYVSSWLMASGQIRETIGRGSSIVSCRSWTLRTGRLVTDSWNQDTDSCAVPVLSPSEAGELSSEEDPLPQPSLSRTYPWKVAELAGRPPLPTTGEYTEEILKEFGIVASERAELMAEGALGTKRSKL